MKQKRNDRSETEQAFSRCCEIPISMGYLYDFASRVIKGSHRCRRLMDKFLQQHAPGVSSHQLVDVLAAFVIMKPRQRARMSAQMQDDDFLSDLCRLSNQIVDRLGI